MPTRRRAHVGRGTAGKNGEASFLGLLLRRDADHWRAATIELVDTDDGFDFVSNDVRNSSLRTSTQEAAVAKLVAKHFDGLAKSG